MSLIKPRVLVTTALIAIIALGIAAHHVAYAVSPTTDNDITHIRVLPHEGVVTKAQANVGIRRLWRGAQPKTTYVRHNVYDARFIRDGVLMRVRTNALAPGLYNLAVTMINGGQVWVRSAQCQQDAIEFASKPFVAGASCN